MLLSELVKQAEALLAEYGDAEIKCEEYSPQWDQSFTKEYMGIKTVPCRTLKDGAFQNEGVRYYRV